MCQPPSHTARLPFVVVVVVGKGGLWVFLFFCETTVGLRVRQCHLFLAGLWRAGFTTPLPPPNWCFFFTPCFNQHGQDHAGYLKT